MKNNKAVFFDRDGVLNYSIVKEGKPYPPKDSDTLEIIENAKELLSKLKEKEFVLICVTNQPDFARGLRTIENINTMNDKIMNALPLDDLFCCLHDTKDNCTCRKPKPGMFFEAANKWNIDLPSSFMIGDRKSDIDAGIAAEAKNIFIDYNYSEIKPINYDFRCSSLDEAVSFILYGEKKCTNKMI